MPRGKWAIRSGSRVAMRQDVRSDSLKAFFNKHPSSSSWHAFGLALSLWFGRGEEGGRGTGMPQLTFDALLRLPHNLVSCLSFV